MRFFKKLYWICFLLGLLCLIFYQKLPEDIAMAGVGVLTVLILVPVARRMNKASKKRADTWYQNFKKDCDRRAQNYDLAREIVREMRR